MRSLFVFFFFCSAFSPVCHIFFLSTLVCNDINAVSDDIAAAAAAALMIYSFLNKCRRARGTAVNGEGV